MVDISAHQGGAEYARPATYGAYQHALATGAEYAELDIRRTKDQVLVVQHDPRCGRAGPRVADLGYAGLCDRLGYEVPKVTEVMALLAGRSIGHLDLKETGYEEEVINLALATLGPGNFVATTLEDISVRNIRRSFPAVRTALSLGRDLKEVAKRRWLNVRRSELFPLDRVRSCGADWVAVNYRLGQFGVIGACERAGIGVMVWTVDADDLIDKFVVDARINVLITNRPAHAVRRRAELAAAGPRPGAS
jgi:glycerophosphoryl diester phosphodiesterase